MIDTSEAIREIRRESELSQREFGERVGVSHGHVSAIEGGHHTPGPDLLRRIAALFADELETLGFALTWESRPTGFERVV